VDLRWWWAPPKHVGMQFDYKNFLNLYMCILLDQCLDNNLIDMHGTNNTVKFVDDTFKVAQTHCIIKQKRML
jgi:hypothetical protein